jgi:hypothetical protein
MVVVVVDVVVSVVVNVLVDDVVDVSIVGETVLGSHVSRRPLDAVDCYFLFFMDFEDRISYSCQLPSSCCICIDHNHCTAHNLMKIFF